MRASIRARRSFNVGLRFASKACRAAKNAAWSSTIAASSSPNASTRPAMSKLTLLIQPQKVISEFCPERDTKGSRIAQKGVRLTDLERSVECDLVEALVCEVLAPHFDNPFTVRRANPDFRIQNSIRALVVHGVQLCVGVVRGVVLLVDGEEEFQRFRDRCLIRCRDGSRP